MFSSYAYGVSNRMGATMKVIRLICVECGMGRTPFMKECPRGCVAQAATAKFTPHKEEVK
jgi:hypothetical protein